jgi:hypothetical protein
MNAWRLVIYSERGLLKIRKQLKTRPGPGQFDM